MYARYDGLLWDAVDYNLLIVLFLWILMASCGWMCLITVDRRVLLLPAVCGKSL